VQSTPPRLPSLPCASLRPPISTGWSRIESHSFETDRIARRSFRKLVEAPTAAITVAFLSDGRLVGYALLLFRAGTGMARLYSIAVLPEMRGSGVGAALVAECERVAFDRDRFLLRLEVREDNASAIHLYERMGYRRIGRYLDYYEDHANALRYEKRLRGDALSTSVRYYEQTTDFTCGPCCVMMALGHLRKDYAMSPVEEIKLWRQATTVFMMAGLGGCDPHGLAVSAARNGLAASIHVSREGSLFLESVRDPEKRRVMELAQEDFRHQTIAFDIPIHHRPLDVAAIQGGTSGRGTGHRADLGLPDVRQEGAALGAGGRRRWPPSFHPRSLGRGPQPRNPQ
jgi:ribosomal protein S18 acetylase RimI-like enzyme